MDLLGDLLQSLAIFVENSNKFIFVFSIHGANQLSTSLKQFFCWINLNSMHIVWIWIAIMTFNPLSQVDWSANIHVLLSDIAVLINSGYRCLSLTLFWNVFFHEVNLLCCELPWFLWLTAIWIILLILVVEGWDKSIVFRLMRVHS